MTTNTKALLRGASRENDAHDEAKADRYCDMGVGCGAYGACYAAANGEPERCSLATHPAPTQPEQAKGRYTVEPHGTGWAIYVGRDMSHHGANIGHLTETTKEVAALIERALNTAEQAKGGEPMTPEQRGVAAEYWGSLAQQKADLDTRRGVSMPVSYYASDAVGAALSHYAISALAAPVSDAVATVRERYRGTKWGKAAECICDAVDEAIFALRPAQAGDQWREAVEEMFAVNHISMPEDPLEAIKKLIATEVRDALDPTISSAAAELVQSGVPDDIVKDAQRYRWLRKSLPAGQGSLTVTLDDRCNGCFNKPVLMYSLDAAIDAAMLAAAPKEGGNA